MDGDTSNKFEHIQDVLGQLTSLKLYTHLALGFVVDKEADLILRELRNAAKQLTQAFPFLAGHVIRRGSGPEKTGLATVVPYPTGERPSLIVVKDCQDMCPSMARILASGAPMSMLDGETLARRKGGPDQYDESREPAPVLEIQANFLQGGLILSFQGNHNIMDMNGMGQLIRLYAKALREEPFTEYEITQGNRDRRDIVQHLDLDQLSDMSRYIPTTKVNVSSQPAAPTSKAKARWVYFTFSAQNLARLKTAASQPTTEAPYETTVPWITTDDALSAFICQRVFNARLKRLPKSPKATICRAINARRFLEPPVPKEYTGHAVTCTYTEVSLDDPAATSDLSRLAHMMRSDVLATNSYAIQSFATKLNSLDDKGGLSFGAQLDLSSFDITVSSWSALEVGVVEFGKVLGNPAFAKRPRLSPMESIIYLMPKTPAGGIDVACCLQGSDIASLQNDAEFMKFGRYVG